MFQFPDGKKMMITMTATAHKRGHAMKDAADLSQRGQVITANPLAAISSNCSKAIWMCGSTHPFPAGHHPERKSSKIQVF